MTFLLPFIENNTTERLEENERKFSWGNFVRKLILSNAPCFIGLQFDHPDRALQKNLEQKKLSARMSLRA